MNPDSLEYQLSASEVGIYDCEIHLKFKLIEEKRLMTLDRDQLLEILLEAFSCGSDDCLQPLEVEVNVEEMPEMQAPPAMRRQLIRLRNSAI